MLVAVRAVEEKPGPSAVIIKTLEKPLPSKEDARSAFLSKFLDNTENQKFDHYTTDNWKQNYGLFADALVKSAQEQKLDAASLRKVLDLILRDSEEKISSRTTIPNSRISPSRSTKAPSMVARFGSCLSNGR